MFGCCPPSPLCSCCCCFKSRRGGGTVKKAAAYPGPPCRFGVPRSGVCERRPHGWSPRACVCSSFLGPHKRSVCKGRCVTASLVRDEPLARTPISPPKELAPPGMTR
ncbi:hypothetical protein MRX96_059339 [Rhipicephalus microplus]